MREYISKHRWSITTLAGLIALVVLYVLFLGPHMMGDTASYTQGLDVLTGGRPPIGFMPYRLLTTFGALEIVRVLGALFGNLYPGWFFMNLIFFVTAGYVMFALVRRVTGSGIAACLSTLFLAGNYGFLLFGPTYLMDIGGWSFYIFTLYFVWRYAEAKVAAHPKAWKYMLYAAICIGIGGMFKEYGFLGGAAVTVYLIVEAIRNGRAQNAALSWKKPLGLLVGAGAISLVPTTVIYTYIYHSFGYTYLDWLGTNAEHYVYHSRILEYVKTLGSLYNLLAFLVIGGAIVIVREWRAHPDRPAISTEVKVFLASMLVSFLPIFCWPAITQRILTVTVPFSVLVASFLFKKYERSPWVIAIFAAILIAYILVTFFMDSYLLNAVNLPFSWGP